MSAQAQLLEEQVRQLAKSCVANGAGYICLVVVPNPEKGRDDLIRSSCGLTNPDNYHAMLVYVAEYLADVLAQKVTPIEDGRPKS